AEVIERFSHAFDAIQDPYLRERAADIRDIGRRVLSALIEEQGTANLDIPQGAVVVADELPPSITARLELSRVSAFVTVRGAKFSHPSILARSQGMPAVSGVGKAPLGIKTGDRLVVDAFAGLVFVNPASAIEGEYERLEGEILADREKLQEL